MNTEDRYKQLHIDIFNCSACKDLGYEIQSVQPRWDENRKPTSIKKWGLFVGQAPGNTESSRSLTHKNKQLKIKKIPFSGQSGKNLEKWFSDGNLSLSTIFEASAKTSITKCYPGRKRGGDRKPTKREISLCRKFLDRQIDLIDPNLIIAIGKQSIQWFLPELDYVEALGKLYFYDNHKVIGLPHPSPAANGFNAKLHIQNKISQSIKLIKKEWDIHQNK